MDVERLRSGSVASKRAAGADLVVVLAVGNDTASAKSIRQSEFGSPYGDGRPT
jgi:hypothetical protein